ncbi:TonB-dependent hemoglobin/transferrin/lactoferrin family receptor [Ignatzschineria cameli]|uniref:TonB-dependent hemoglobin/transferrin/lactoferrin family receptor n=1 Tax=Ignatzschineria cameli TaxID=2182793 RepID=UPI000D6071F4|nr:TonB-dependent hemoglobin/transferrin/lactoferrin family receptor [Ignatzschineria cameli]PWD83544.1 TonB-dependent hemoglobin/transferrin/lactoferrin family receptor [Ignatzschineria cameli]
MKNKSRPSFREGASALFSFQNSFSPLLFTGICALSLLSVSISVALADDEEELPTIALGSVVVVGAPAQTSPFKQTQTATDLSKNLVQDERDLLRHELSVGVNESGRAGSNGFAIRGVDKDRVAVIVDGLPQAETFMPSIYKGYGYFNGSINSAEYENISSVTVNKGANSVSDGSGAVGGSLYFTTKSVDDIVKPGQKWGLYWKTGYSSKNREWRQVLGAGYRGDRFFGFAQFTKRRGHETINSGSGEEIYGPARGRPDPQMKHSSSWLTKWGINITDEQTLTAFYENRRQSNRTEERSFNSFGTYRFANDTAPYRRFGLEYDYIPLESTWLDTFNIVYADQKIDMRADSYNVSEKDPSKITQHYYRAFDQRQKILKTQLFTLPLNLGEQEHLLQAKLEYRRGELKNSNRDILYLSGVAHPEQYSIMTPVKSSVTAFSLQDEITIAPQLSLTLGARYDHYQYSPQMDGSNKFPVSFDSEKKSFSKISWQLGINYQITPEQQIGYRISTGFRAPKIEELFFEFGKGGMNHFMPNPQLRPETALNQEITYQFKNEYAEIGLGAFYSKYRNFIDERVSEKLEPNPYYPYEWGSKPYLSINQIQFVNVAHAHISGLELNATLNGPLLGLSESWKFHLKGQYSKGKNQDGDPLKSIQPWSALMSVEYQDPSQRWNSILTARYSAAKRGKDTKETQYSWRGKEEKEWPWLSPSYFVVDLTTQVKLDRDITLNFGVFNLFNRSYSTWDNLRDLPTFGTTNRIDPDGRGLERFTAPKRNFAISIEGRF